MIKTVKAAKFLFIGPLILGLLVVVEFARVARTLVGPVGRARDRHCLGGELDQSAASDGAGGWTSRPHRFAAAQQGPADKVLVVDVSRRREVASGAGDVGGALGIAKAELAGAFRQQGVHRFKLDAAAAVEQLLQPRTPILQGLRLGRATVRNEPYRKSAVFLRDLVVCNPLGPGERLVDVRTVTRLPAAI